MTALEGIGGCAAPLGHHLEGARLLGAAHAARHEHEFRFRFPFEQQMVDDATTQCREALGNDAFDAAFAEGATRPWAASVEFANDPGANADGHHTAGTASPQPSSASSN